MPHFRKRPVIISAEQWFPGKNIDGMFYDATLDRWLIPTLEGPHTVSPGDWIITGVKGEKYACKPDIFAQTYDQVDDI